MEKDKIILSMVETEDGIEVHMAEEAYNNFVVIGLIEKIKMELLSKPSLPMRELSNRIKNLQDYDA